MELYSIYFKSGEVFQVEAEKFYINENVISFKAESKTVAVIPIESFNAIVLESANA